MKVQLKNGEEKWILIHVEIQGTNEANFAERMFQYFYRIYDQYKEKIVAIAIMTAETESKYAEQFNYHFFGTTVQYTYNSIKLTDYSIEELKQSTQLFSKIILATKYMHHSKHDHQKRLTFKTKLMREILKNESNSRAATEAVFYFIDYLLKLPKHFSKKIASTMYPFIEKEVNTMELSSKREPSPTLAEIFKMKKREGMVEGKEEGQLEQKKIIAKKLLQTDLSIEEIANIVELTINEIKTLQDK